MVVESLPPHVSSHKYTTAARSIARAQPKPTNYGLIFDDYEDILNFLERVKGDPDLASQIVALLESEWRPAVTTALDQFCERIQCSKCTSVPGAPGLHCRLSPDCQRRLDALILEMKMFPLENLSLGKLMTFKSRLWQLEKEYLDAHLGKSCKGLG
jgi:hypothetical protein